MFKPNTYRYKFRPDDFKTRPASGTNKGGPDSILIVSGHRTKSVNESEALLRACEDRRLCQSPYGGCRDAWVFIVTTSCLAGLYAALIA